MKVSTTEACLWVQGLGHLLITLSNQVKYSQYNNIKKSTKFKFIAYHTGFLKGSTKWGPWPKVVFGATFGYFMGKLSYQSVCAEKLMTLPNSPLAEALRQRKGKSGKAGFQEA